MLSGPGGPHRNPESSGEGAPAALAAEHGVAPPPGVDGGPPELFGTETMAELYARQGRVAEAIAVYRRLLANGPAAEGRARWLLRLEALDPAPGGAGAPRAGDPPPPR